LSNVCLYRYCNVAVPVGRKYCSLPCSYKEKGIVKRKTPSIQVCKNEDCLCEFEVIHKNQAHCSRKCAAKCNNSKRVKPKLCLGCSCSINHKGNYCDNCRYKTRKSGEDYTNTTLGELKERYSLHQFHAKLRGNSRSVYARSGNPLFCRICGYSKHVDICHVKQVSEFDESTKISEVNSINNLVTLCKNHHWELDNNQLSLEDAATLSDVIEIN
jgi:hypothetical protein